MSRLDGSRRRERGTGMARERKAEGEEERHVQREREREREAYLDCADWLSNPLGERERVGKPFSVRLQVQKHPYTS